MNHNNCSICNNVIPDERIEALKILEINPSNFLCLSCSSKTGKTVKGVFTGEDDTSNMILVSGLGDFGIEKLENDLPPDDDKDSEL